MRTISVVALSALLLFVVGYAEFSYTPISLQMADSLHDLGITTLKDLMPTEGSGGGHINPSITEKYLCHPNTPVHRNTGSSLWNRSSAYYETGKLEDVQTRSEQVQVAFRDMLIRSVAQVDKIHVHYKLGYIRETPKVFDIRSVA